MLTDKHCKNAICPPGKKQARFTDSGGLYLQVSPAGSKRWFWKTYTDGKEGRMALGSYPTVSLADARRARDAAKLQKASGVNPVKARKLEKLKASGNTGGSFKEIALDWYKRRAPQWSPGHADRAMRQLERDIFPWLGDRCMADIESVELLKTIKKIEERGAIETADRALMLCRQIWHFGMASGQASRDITMGLKQALTPYRGVHLGAITDPMKLGELLRAIHAYRGGLIVRAAIQLAPLLFQRPGELRAAEWSEMNLDAGLWTIPAARMKRNLEGKEHGAPHLVPLSSQAVAILRDLHRITGHGKYVFHGERSHDRPISENSVRTALITMGYTSDVHTWHGFRATARTMLAEVLEFPKDIIEAQLAHAVSDANGRAYNRTQFMKQRADMMQRWSDYLDDLRKGAG